MKAQEPLAEGRPERVVNWRVADLEAFCAQLEIEGIAIDKRGLGLRPLRLDPRPGRLPV